MSIGQKMVLGFAGISLLLAAMGYIAVTVSQEEMQKNIKENRVILAGEILDKIDRSIYYRLEESQSYSRDALLRETVEASNREFDQMDDVQTYINSRDKQWVSVPAEAVTPFMRGLMDNRLSKELKEKIGFYEEKYGYKLFGEIFATNKYGVNVAQTKKTSDYRQDDEEWWQRAKKDGLYVRNFGYDESAHIYSIDICVRIDDEAGNFLGVMKMVLNVNEVVNIILKEIELDRTYRTYKTRAGEPYRTMGLKLLARDGRIIYSTEKNLFFQNIYKERIAPLQKSDGPDAKNYFIMPGKASEGEELFVHVRSKGYKDFTGLGWILVLEDKTERIFAPVTRLKRVLLMISLCLFSVAVLFSLYISRALSAPIRELKDAALKMKKGEFDIKLKIRTKDEIGHLAEAFNNMAEDLKFSIKKEKEFAAQAISAAAMEKKRSEELQKAQKILERHADELVRSNKELEEFAYIASHDLQEPLRKVKTFGDRLIQKYGETLKGQGEDYLQRMSSAVSRMQRLIDSLLTYSRISSKAQPFTNVPLKDIVRDALSDLEIKIEETHAQVHVGDLPVVEADPIQMRQLFQNLIANALKFRSPERAPCVEVQRVLKEQPAGNTWAEGEICTIKVSDNGIGIDEKYHDLIFGVFQRLYGRSEYEGTGIGLAVCRKIVLRHRGRIRVESAPGQGSAFFITLPMKQPKKEGS